LIRGLEAVIPGTGLIGAGRANDLALEKFGRAAKPPLLPGGLPSAVCVNVRMAAATMAARIVVFIY
jgi:hypothetical protein